MSYPEYFCGCHGPCHSIHAKNPEELEFSEGCRQQNHRQQHVAEDFSVETQSDPLRALDRGELRDFCCHWLLDK
jgi:hypothetical protein